MCLGRKKKPFCSSLRHETLFWWVCRISTMSLMKLKYCNQTMAPFDHSAHSNHARSTKLVHGLQVCNMKQTRTLISVEVAPYISHTGSAEKGGGGSRCVSPTPPSMTRCVWHIHTRRGGGLTRQRCKGMQCNRAVHDTRATVSNASIWKLKMNLFSMKIKNTKIWDPNCKHDLQWTGTSHFQWGFLRSALRPVRQDKFTDAEL